MKIFLSTPIAGFGNELEYKKYRKWLLEIHKQLCEKYGEKNVVAAFFSAKDYDSYDSPSTSAKEDIYGIESCDVFVMFYPVKNPTSALVELGYALAQNKKILIVSPKVDVLPYMVQGFHEAYPKQVKWTNSMDSFVIVNMINSLWNDESC